jgi:hypothetical protein
LCAIFFAVLLVKCDYERAVLNRQAAARKADLH